tara:strand:+ start:1801 stop:2103 length:303 start_codon:yes stop_codon:yes gene_type:complete
MSTEARNGAAKFMGDTTSYYEVPPGIAEQVHRHKYPVVNIAKKTSKTMILYERFLKVRLPYERGFAVGRLQSWSLATTRVYETRWILPFVPAQRVPTFIG